MKTKLLLCALLGLAGLLHAQTPAERLDAFFKKAEQNGYAGSVLVADASGILLEKGYGWQDRENKKPQTAATVFSVGSITKQFTGAAIVKLEMQGKLSVQDPLSKYFPEAPADKAGITLHQLLTHTAGFPGAIGDDYEQVDAAAFARLALAEPLLFAPGARHEYSNVGYSLLGIIVEKVSGKNYETYLYENLWRPAGMEHTGYLRPGFKPAQLAVGYRNGERWGTALDRAWLADGPGWHLRANGGVLSTVGDLHRWFAALQGDKILDAAAKAKYLTGQVRECPDCPGSYGYGWVIETAPDGRKLVWHNGGNGVYNAFMGFAPEVGLCIVVSSNSNDKISDDFAQKIQQILAGEESLPDATVQKFTGAYRLPSGPSVRARFDEFDKLWLEWDDKDALQLLSGSGQETAAATAPYLERSFDIVTGIQKGDYKALAAATESTTEEAAGRARPFWRSLQDRFGPVTAVEKIGVVSRRGGAAHVVFLRIRFAKTTRYVTHVWLGDSLDDVRISDRMDKEFEPQSAREFLAPNNQKTVLLNEDGSLTVKGKTGESTVLRRGE